MNSYRVEASDVYVRLGIPANYEQIISRLVYVWGSPAKYGNTSRAATAGSQGVTIKVIFGADSTSCCHGHVGKGKDTEDVFDHGALVVYISHV